MLAIIAAVSVAILAHLAPFPFLLDTTKHTVWRMPRGDVPTIYLTFDDGPNPAATPLILDALARHNARATFFVIDKHLTRDTAPIVTRAASEGTRLRCTGTRASRCSRVLRTWPHCCRKRPRGWNC
jgi:peptidoglycan/xylan/chitin deacetylase (PgdA/CDA1 family)